MNSHIWIKQAAPFLDGSKYLNQINSANPAGIIQSVPGGLASQGEQNVPGDVFFFDTDAALALSDTVNIGTLYSGLYKLVRTASGSTAAPARGKACFWDTSVADDLMQVTPDESGAQGVGLFAGFYLNSLTKGNYGFIQIAGKCTGKFRAVLTGVAANGQPVFLAGAGAGADVGTLDVFGADGNAATLADAAQFCQRFVGSAEGLPVAGTVGTVCIKYGPISYHV